MVPAGATAGMASAGQRAHRPGDGTWEAIPVDAWPSYLGSEEPGVEGPRGESWDELQLFVLDEADEMFFRGFQDQIYDIFKVLPPNVQVCLFSATMPPEILDITIKFM